MKIINKYILKTFFSYFFIYFGVTSLLFLLSYIYQLISSLLTYKTEFVTSIKLCLYLLPSIFSLTIPISLLISVLFTFSMLNETSESVILQTMGVKKSFYFKNLVILSVLLTIIIFYFNTIYVPKSYKQFRYTFINYVISKPYVSFNSYSVVLQNKKIVYQKFVEQKKNEFVLYNVYIFSPIEKDIIQTIFAKVAKVFINSNGDIIFNLHQGEILTFDKTLPSQLTYINFDSYKFVIPNSQIKKIVTESLNLRELSNKELLQEFYKTTIINYKKFILAEYFLRHTISLSIVVFTIIGIVVGSRIKRNAKSLSFVFAIVIICVYYFLLIGSMSFVENANISPNFVTIAFIMYLPNIFLLILSFILSIIL